MIRCVRSPALIWIDQRVLTRLNHASTHIHAVTRSYVDGIILITELPLLQLLLKLVREREYATNAV